MKAENLKEKMEATKELTNLIGEKEALYEKEGSLEEADIEDILKAMGNCQKAMQDLK